MKPARNYVVPGKELDFHILTEIAAHKNEIALGCKNNGSKEKEYSIVINPRKNERFILENDDEVIVLSEDWFSV